MNIRPMKPILACVSLLCLPLLASTAQAASYDWSASCTNGNNKGEVKGHYINEGNRWTVRATSYKINGRSDRNKANLNIRLVDGKHGGSPTPWTKSPDSMRQDGRWHAAYLSQSGNYPIAGVRAEFIFDTPGNDPKCTAGTTLKKPAPSLVIATPRVGS